jgi:transcription elongation factor Elf1
MTAKQREARNAQLRSAMAGLIQDTRFQQFIDLLRDHREGSVRDSCTDAVVKCQRLSLAAVGEIKAYTNLIDVYDDFVSQAEEGKLGQADVA